MKKSGLLLLMLCLGITLFGQVKTVIKGYVKNEKMKSVAIFKVEDGIGKLVASTEAGDDGSYELSFSPEQPGFYILGDTRWNYPVYVKGGEEVNIDLLAKTAQLTGKNTKENKALYVWENLVGAVRWMSSSIFCAEATYKEFFPEFTKVLGQVDKTKKKIRSGNEAFDVLLRKKIDYDLDFYAVNLLMTPRLAHPERSEWLPYYDTILSDKKFTTDEVLQFPNGLAMVSAYINFAGMKTSQYDLNVLNNDRLKGEAFLLRLRNVKLRSSCESQIKENERYLVTEDQKARAEAFLKKFPESLNGKPAIGFTYPDVNGKEVSLSDFKGSVVLVDVWATWCGPCVREMPALKKLEEEMKGKDVVFIGVSIDQEKDKQKWLDFVSKENLEGVHLNAVGGGQLVKDYSVSGIPRFILIDKKGYVVAENAPRPSSPELKEMIEKELAK